MSQKGSLSKVSPSGLQVPPPLRMHVQLLCRSQKVVSGMSCNSDKHFSANIQKHVGQKSGNLDSSRSRGRGGRALERRGASLPRRPLPGFFLPFCPSRTTECFLLRFLSNVGVRKSSFQLCGYVSNLKFPSIKSS